MKQVSSITGNFTLFMVALFSSFYSCEAKARIPSSDFTLVASTPGDEEMKSLLQISSDTKVDFIRWDLMLTTTKSNKQTFLLYINYGESQPNTLGFKNGGEKKSIAGSYTISHDKARIGCEVYHLTSTELPTEISMQKLSSNIFHLLTPQKQLRIGNGGWSYTLNRKDPLPGPFPDLPALTTLANLSADTAQQIIFDGRTPCVDFAAEKHMTVAPDCFKLKWKLTLHKDPKTLAPAGYTLRRTNSRQSDITGEWAIQKGLPSNPNVIVYQLDPDKPAQSISLLLGDENVLFFLHKDYQFFTGNENFSYTLNRRVKN